VTRWYLRDVVDPEDDLPYGTAARDAPVSRMDFERALRGLNTNDMLIHDQLLQLAAQVVALTDELTRRLDGVEPRPAPPQTPAQLTGMTVETMVAMMSDATLSNVRANNVLVEHGPQIDSSEDKYTAVAESPPCAELIAICHARCCKLRFALTTQDLDEGIIRWDYGRPYMIRQRASDERCVHNDPATRFCTVHAARPHVCRTYHCRDDNRIWIDYDKRIPQPEPNDETKTFEFDLMDRVRARQIALFNEQDALSTTYPDKAPTRGVKG
jgi:Fe-S-cluster containining protein